MLAIAIIFAAFSLCGCGPDDDDDDSVGGVEPLTCRPGHNEDFTALKDLQSRPADEPYPGPVGFILDYVNREGQSVEIEVSGQEDAVKGYINAVSVCFAAFHDNAEPSEDEPGLSFPPDPADFPEDERGFGELVARKPSTVVLTITVGELELEEPIRIDYGVDPEIETVSTGTNDYRAKCLTRASAFIEVRHGKASVALWREQPRHNVGTRTASAGHTTTRMSHKSPSPRTYDVAVWGWFERNVYILYGSYWVRGVGGHC